MSVCMCVCVFILGILFSLTFWSLFSLSTIPLLHICHCTVTSISFPHSVQVPSLTLSLLSHDKIFRFEWTSHWCALGHECLWDPTSSHWYYYHSAHTLLSLQGMFVCVWEGCNSFLSLSLYIYIYILFSIIFACAIVGNLCTWGIFITQKCIVTQSLMLKDLYPTSTNDNIFCFLIALYIPHSGLTITP